MKTRFLILLLLIAPVTSWAWMGIHVAGGGVPAAVLSCESFESSTTDTDYENGGLNDATRYMGMTYNYGSAKTICQVCFKLTEVGDLNSKTIYYEVWSKTGTSLNAVLASGTTSGANVNGSLLCIELSSSVALSASTDYAITASTHENDGSNYFTMRSGTTSTWEYGQLTRWNADKTVALNWTKDPVFDLYAE